MLRFLAAQWNDCWEVDAPIWMSVAVSLTLTSKEWTLIPR